MRYLMRFHMKIINISIFLFILFIAGQAAGQDTAENHKYYPYPEPGAGYVTDTADILSNEEEERIEQWLWQAESRRQIEIIVVLIDSIKDYEGTENTSIEKFATALFNKYGIGNMPKNDGILLLVAKKDRKARIELGAYYGNSDNNLAVEIMQDKIIPRFRAGEYAEGVTEGVRAILLQFGGLRIGFPWHFVYIPGAIIILILIAHSLFKRGKKGWGWVAVGLIFVLISALMLLAWSFLKHQGSGRSSGWSSGGMGGFGGGFSGGGGATGSW